MLKKIENINFYNGDCMDLMKGIKDNYYDVAICDPPYGGLDAMNIKSTKSPTNSGIKANHYAKRTLFEQFENVQPDKEYFDQLKRISKHQIVWGWNFLEHANMQGGMLVWDKKGTAFGRAEVAYCSMFNSVKIYELQWNGFLKHPGSEELKRWHPTAKPRRLYEYCLINLVPDKAIILDTHGGSMSIARAVYDVNKMKDRDLTLDIVESNKTYYENAINDFIQHTKQQTLF